MSNETSWEDLIADSDDRIVELDSLLMKTDQMVRQAKTMTSDLDTADEEAFQRVMAKADDDYHADLDDDADGW